MYQDYIFTHILNPWFSNTQYTHIQNIQIPVPLSRSFICQCTQFSAVFRLTCRWNSQQARGLDRINRLRLSSCPLSTNSQAACHSSSQSINIQVFFLFIANSCTFTFDYSDSVIWICGLLPPVHLWGSCELWIFITLLCDAAQLHPLCRCLQSQSPYRELHRIQGSCPPITGFRLHFLQQPAAPTFSFNSCHQYLHNFYPH